MNKSSFTTTATAHQHTCAVPGCEKTIPRRLLMCRTHWFMVPRKLQTAVGNAYRPGQENDLNLSPAYLSAMYAAIQAVDPNYVPPRGYE